MFSMVNVEESQTLQIPPRLLTLIVTNYSDQSGRKSYRLVLNVPGFKRYVSIWFSPKSRKRFSFATAEKGLV
jgi:hypothetical protein